MILLVWDQGMRLHCFPHAPSPSLPGTPRARDMHSVVKARKKVKLWKEQKCARRLAEAIWKGVKETWNATLSSDQTPDPDREEPLPRGLGAQ